MRKRLLSLLTIACLFGLSNVITYGFQATLPLCGE